MPKASGRLKAFHRVVADDQSALFRVRFVGDDNAAGSAVTSADAAVAAASLTFRINAAAEGINDYTGASGGAGVLTFADANADSIRESLNVINGIGPGMASGSDTNRRWRAAQGDFPLDFTLDATTGLVTGAADALLGHRSEGLALLADRSAVGGSLWVGVGTERALVKGGGLKVPDYFEDLPGVSGISGFSSNTPDRTRQKAKQNDAGVVVEAWTPVITYVSANVDFANNDTGIRIWDNSLDPDSDSPLFLENLGDTSVASGSPDSRLLNGQPGGFEFRGTAGEPLFVEVFGTGAFTDEGGVVVSGYYELSLRR